VIQQGGSEIVAKHESSVTSMLQQLTARVATENNKEVALQCMGFDTVPDEYRRIVKDIAVQAVRNSIVHALSRRPSGWGRKVHAGPAQADIPGAR